MSINMDKYKEPAMLLSTANSIAIVGTSAYFYKQMEAIRTDIIKISQTLTTVVKKVNELDKNDQGRNESLRILNEDIKQLNGSVSDLPSFEELENVNQDVEEIVATLSEKDIKIALPSKEIRQPVIKYRGSRNNNNSRQSSRNNHNDYEEEAPKSRQFRGNSNNNNRNNNVKQQDTRNNRKTTNPPLDTDEDLINSYRSNK